MSNWEWKKLGDVCDIINGRNQKEVMNPQGAYPICGSGGVMGYADKYLCRENTVIIGRKGSINNPIYVQEKFWNVDTAFGLQSKDNYLPKLLYYFCIGYDFSKHNKGTTIPSLVKSDLLEIPIPVPPLAEQKRIVKTLDEKFAKIDKLKIVAETNLKNAREIFNAELNSKLNVESENLPKGWERKHIGDIADIKGGKRIPKGEKLLTQVTDHPYIRVTAFNDDGSVNLDDIHYISNEIYEGIKRYIITTDDAYVSIAGTIGKCGIVPQKLNNANLTENACRLIFNKNVFNRYFVYFSLSSEFKKATQNEARANAMPKLSLLRLSQIQFPLPPLSEQKRIVAHLDKLSEKVKRLEEIYRRTIADCEELKKSILKKTFEGES